jgi:uncharacterized membrane protein
MVTLAIFTALIIVLQFVSNVAKIGPVSITLSLVPIVVGAALFGVSAGAYLGGVFGVVVLLFCITGMDVGGSILWNTSPLVTGLVCLGKGILAGAAAGAVYRSLARRSGRTSAALCAGIVCPLVNTGLFCLAMVLFFRETLTAWAGGSGILYYIIFGLAGVNFVVELAVNLVLSPVIVRILDARR